MSEADDLERQILEVIDGCTASDTIMVLANVLCTVALATGNDEDLIEGIEHILSVKRTKEVQKLGLLS